MSGEIQNACTLEHNHWPIYLGVNESRYISFCEKDIGKLFVRTVPPISDPLNNKYIPENLDASSILKAAVLLTKNSEGFCVTKKGEDPELFPLELVDGNWVEAELALSVITIKNRICFNFPLPDRTPNGFDENTHYCTYTTPGEKLDTNVGQWVVRLRNATDLSFVATVPSLKRILSNAVWVKDIKQDGSIAIEAIDRAYVLLSNWNNDTWIKVSAFFDQVKPEHVVVHKRMRKTII